MSGPFANTISQMVEELNWAGTDQKLTWDNFRFGPYAISTSGGTGWVPFSTPFPREIITTCISVGFDGGVRNWLHGIRDVSIWGFTIEIVFDNNWGLGPHPVDGTSVGVYYVAIGR